MKIDYKYLILIFFFPFISLFDRFMYPFFKTQGMTYMEIGVIDAIYSAVSLAVLYYFGHVSDRIGRRKALAGFIMLYAPFPIIYARVSSFFQAVAVRAVQTVSCPMYPVESAYEQDLAHSISSKTKATFFGILSMVSGIGYFLYPMLGGFVAETFGFHALALLASITVLLVALIVLLLPETSKTTNRKIKDKIDFGILRGSDFLKAFSVYEFLMGISFVITFIWIPFFALDITGSYFAAGSVISAASFFMIIGRVLFGYLADRYGRERIFVIAGFIAPLSLVFLALSNSILSVILSSLLASLASSLMIPAQSALLSKCINPKLRGGLFNALTFIFTGGIVIGDILGGLVTTYYSISFAFLFAAVIDFVAISIFVYVLKKKRVPDVVQIKV
jgi:MFS family permease